MTDQWWFGYVAGAASILIVGINIYLYKWWMSVPTFGELHE